MSLNERKERVLELLRHFDASQAADLRQEVISLIPVWEELRKLGVSLIPHGLKMAARARLLYYFQRYSRTIISHHELVVVAGISDWPRRMRELRREMGWPIVSGLTAKEMQEEGDIFPDEGLPDCSDMGPDDYIMIDAEQDREAAFRWKLANDIRKSKTGARASILKFLQHNVGKPIPGDELRYVANDASEWARRTRELRTQEGWQIFTHWNGRPDLKPGMYILESTRQLPAHDRTIPDATRRAVLVRDNYTCQGCGWTREQWTKDDPRHIELHHLKEHAKGGENTEENLLTLCNVCHDTIHSK